MDYLYLTPKERAELIRQRLVSMETEHFQRALDRTIGEELGDAGRQMADEAARAQPLIEAASRVAERELAELEQGADRG